MVFTERRRPGGGSGWASERLGAGERSGAGSEYGVEWVVCVFDPMSWSRKTGPVDSCDAVDSLNDALDCQIRNAARWGRG